MAKHGLKKILLVDDDTSLLEFIRDILDNSYHVFTAQKAYEALRIIHDHAIDLLTIDFMMPDMTGFDVLKEIRKFDENLPFIIITGHPLTELMRYEDLRDAKGILSKPFSINQLRGLVAESIKS